MVDFRNGIYTEKFMYKDNDGIEQTLVLRPLPGKHLAALFGVVSKLNTGTGENMDMSKFDKETVQDLYDMCLVTLERSNKGVNKEDLEEFVSVHFLELFPVIINLHFREK